MRIDRFVHEYRVIAALPIGEDFVAAKALALVRIRRSWLEKETGADERINGNVRVGPFNEAGESGGRLHKDVSATLLSQSDLVSKTMKARG